MKFILSSPNLIISNQPRNTITLDSLKELRNCILCIIRMWSLFYIRVYISLHFLRIPLIKLSFHLFVRASEFLFLDFMFSGPCFEINVILKDLVTFV